MKNTVCLLYCRRSLLLIAVLCLGILAGYYLLRPAATAPGRLNADATPGTAVVADRNKDNPDDTLVRLRQRLTQAEQERRWLAERVASLEAVIEKLGTYPSTGTGIQATETKEETEPAASAQTFRTSVEALIETGIPAEQAVLIQARLDEYDLKQLYIKDSASREGWLNTPRYSKELRQAQNAYRELRPEIGDDAYDRMLYALGRVNRVAVRDIMKNSTAEQYGLQTSDRIIEYDSQRVFTSQELNELITHGTAGTLVLVRVLREDQLLDFYIPRGPIGIRLAPTRELP